MKRLVFHAVIAAVAAAAGWLAGAPSAFTQGKGGRIRSVSATAAVPTAGRLAAGWQGRLTSVRAVPGAASEPAWVKWALSIPDAEVPAAIAKLDPRSDFHALRCLYARWVKLDPAAAWASFRASAIPKESRHFFIPASSPEPGAGFVGLGIAQRHEEPRSLIAARMLASWATVDPAAARAFAAKLSNPASAEAKEFAINDYELQRTVGKLDATGEKKTGPSPAEAAAAALELPKEATSRRSDLGNAAAKWLRSDPAAACAWIQQLDAEDRKQLPIESIGWAMKGAPLPERAAILTAMLIDRGLPAEKLEQTISRTEAGGYLMGGSYALSETSAALKEWAKTDPAAVQKWLSSLPDDAHKPTLAGFVAAGLAVRDPNAALTLLNQTPGDQQPAVTGLMAGWVESNATAALAWAAKIEDEPLRDACRRMAVSSLARTDAALAIETAQSIADDNLRRRAIGTIRQSLSWNPAALANFTERFPGDDLKRP